jgi:hypothetical protein
MSLREQRQQRKPKKDFPILPGMSEAEIEIQIRKRIKHRIEQRNEFVGHAVSFAVVNIVLWLIWIGSGASFSGGIPWPAYVTFFWGLGLFMHGWEVYQGSGSVQARRERMIQDEIAMEKERLGIYEKPKRDQLAARRNDGALQVSDDGELVPLDELLADDNNDSESRSRSMNGGGRL